MIKIDFELGSEYGVFRDALYLPPDHAYTDVEIQAMKDQRLANWIAAIQSAPQQADRDYIEVDGIRYVKAVT